MPKVVVTSESKASAQESFTKICDLLENDKELRKLDPAYNCNFNSETLTGTAKGSQFKANMKVTEKASGALVEIEVDLPFHLALAKGVVQKTLQKKMDQALA